MTTTRFGSLLSLSFRFFLPQSFGTRRRRFVAVSFTRYECLISSRGLLVVCLVYEEVANAPDTPRWTVIPEFLVVVADLLLGAECRVRVGAEVVVHEHSSSLP